jgi:antitoxin component YwqK of YwqJK toxin-antitoxin module
LYYPETGRIKARIVRKKMLDEIVEAWDEDGKQTVFNSSGNISGNFPMFDRGYVEIELKDGRAMGEETRYYDKDKKILRSRTTRDSKDSMRYHRSTFYENRQVETAFSFVWQKHGDRFDIALDGPYKAYYGNGKPASSAMFRNDLLIGHYQHWNAYGILVSEISFAEQNTSDAMERFTVDDLMLSGSGVLNGASRYWNDAGVLIREESYVMGNRDGVWKTWHTNGVLATEKTYKDDKAVGKARYFDEQGKRIKSPTDDCPTQNWGSGFICSKHQNEAVTDDLGICRNCGDGTSSGMYSLCEKCACRLKKCQRCGRDL